MKFSDPAEAGPNARSKVVVVDDDPAILKIFERILARGDHEIVALTNAHQLLSLLDDPTIDVVVTDVLMPDMDGIELCTKIKEKRPDVEVVVMTGAGSVEVAVRAMRAGAYDFLTKPFLDTEVVTMAVSKALEHKSLLGRTKYLEKQVELSSRFENIIGASSKMKAVFRLIESVAPTDSAVLVTGRSGTGKELVARAIHERSQRRSGPFLPVHCSALTETLLESELFGHVKGAFTGATGSRKGLFEEADGGTLFLDEVGETPLETQVKILRALEEGEIKPVGSSQMRKVDVRLISATNVDLRAAVEAGRFRQDLFYRINVLTIAIPPLCERPEDIPSLVHHFLRRCAAKTGKKIESVDPEVMTALLAHNWPGNVRELGHVIERAMVLTSGNTIGLPALPEEVVPVKGGSAAAVAATPGVFGLPYGDAKSRAVAAFEQAYLHDMLARAEGNIAAAARLAGMDRSNFRRLLERYEIDISTHQGD